MKVMKMLSIIVLCLLVSVFYGISDADHNVYVIYFRPTDAPDIDREYHNTMLKDIQQYFQSEMTRHGYIDSTFPLELDNDNKLVIHIVNGKHNTEHYDVSGDGVWSLNEESNLFHNIVKPELPFRFNNDVNWNSRDNVHFIMMGGIKGKGNWNGTPAIGHTWHAGRWGGNAFIGVDRKTDFPNHYIGVVAHGLGHAFGLDPNNNDDVPESLNGTVVAWGATTAEWGNKMLLLDFEAKELDRRPIFRKMNLQLSVNPHRKLTLRWATLKSRK